MEAPRVPVILTASLRARPVSTGPAGRSSPCGSRKPRIRRGQLHPRGQILADSRSGAQGLRCAGRREGRCSGRPHTLQSRSQGSRTPERCLHASARPAWKRRANSTRPALYSGRLIFPGMAPGSGLGWATMAGPQPLGIGLDLPLRGVRRSVVGLPGVFRSSATWVVRKRRTCMLNALDLTLKPFFAPGGKLIHYHG